MIRNLSSQVHGWKWIGLVALLLWQSPVVLADKIEVYTVPKQHQPSSLPAGHPPMDAHNHGAVGMGTPTITYTTPEGWEDTGSGQMRVAGFNIPGTNGQSAQVAVTPLPGLEGKEALIVNMWRQQVGLGELSEADATKELTNVEIDGQSGKMFDMAGNSAAGPTIRILTAMMHRDGQSWFFKLQGNDELVAAQKPNFIAFLKSVKIEVSAAPAALPEGHPPLGNNSMPGAVTSEQPPKPRQGGPTWIVPPGWKEIDGGQFLFAKFVIAGAGESQAVVNISTSGGMGGGLAANINRWRGQLGLGPWSETDLSKNVSEIELASGKGSYVEISGTDSNTEKPATILGAKVTTGGNTWYYKLMGEPALVAAQKDSFVAFVKGVKY